MTDVPLESVNRTLIPKPLFLFGDHSEDPEPLELGSYRWLRTVGERSMFLPMMERDCSLTDLRAASVPRQMNWDLTPSQDGVTCGHFSRDGAQLDRHNRYITGLHPGSFQRDLPVGETAAEANTFGRTFHTSERQFPAKDFRTPGWSRWGASQWWPRLTEYILREHSEDLKRFGLYAPIRATQLGLRTNSHQFFGILELYNPDTRTFFTPDGELGIALHEMAEVSGLPYGRYPYEEYVPGHRDLVSLEKDYPQVVETYWELMCHYHICVCSQGRAEKKGEKTISHSIWAHYLFTGLDNKTEPVLPLGPLEAGPLSQLVLRNLPLSYVPDTDEHGFPAGKTFDTYIYQAGEPLSSKAALAGYLMLWLKHIVVPCGSFEVLPHEVIFPAVCMAHGRQYALLPAMLARLHWGLRSLCYAFNHGAENPRVELPYAYLMAWFVMHCPTLMSAPSAQVDGQTIPFVQRLENSEWSRQYMVSVRRALRDYKNYSFNRCFPRFSGVSYGQTLLDESDAQGYTTLSLGCFQWLLTIRPGYFIFRVGPVCIVEPYLPCRFARQFGYGQLYVGNPNPQLQSDDCSLITGARAWYWSVAGGTGVRFSLPQRDPQLRMTLAYCQWHCMANAAIPGFNINSSGLRLIRRRYKEGQRSNKSRMPGLKEFMTAEEDIEVTEPTAAAEAETEEALHESIFPSPSRFDEYGSNIPSAAGVEETVQATSTAEVPADEPLEHPPQESPAVPASPSRPTGAAPPETTLVPESTEAEQVEEREAMAPTAQGPKRPGPPRTKRLAKKLRREPLVEATMGQKSDDDVPLSQLPLRRHPVPEARGADASTAVAPPPTTTVVAVTSAGSPVTPSANQSQTVSPPASPTSPFDKSKEYGVTMIRNNFLTILRESPAQVLERGGDFAGIKAVLEPLLGVMESLTNATATLPYRTHLAKIENLFQKWQSCRGESLAPKIEDRTRQLLRARDDSQFELQRQVLEKKQVVQQLGEMTKDLFAEKKRIADVEHNQQLLVDSYKAALLDLQTKLAAAEHELEAATERHQALTAQWAEHQATVQAESDDLEHLSVAVSQMPVLSDDDLHRQATEEIKAAHREATEAIAAEIRQAVERL